MIPLFDIDIARSIASKKLIFLETKRENRPSLQASYLIFGIAIVGAAIFLASGTGIRSILMAAPVVAAAVYGIYRKMGEFELMAIATHISTQQAREIILEYLQGENFGQAVIHENCIMAYGYSSIETNNVPSKVYVFLITDGQVFFNVRNPQFRSDLPLFYTHLSLKGDMGKVFGPFKGI